MEISFRSTQALNLDLDSFCIYDSVFDYGICYF